MRAAFDKEATDPEAAEVALFSLLQGRDLAPNEFDRTHAAACRLREQRMRPMVESLDTVTAEQAAELHQMLGACRSLFDLQLRVAALEEMEANQAIEAAREAEHPHAQLAAALPHTDRLQSGNEHREWFTATVTDRQNALLNAAEGATASDLPVTAAWLARLAERAGAPTPSQSVADAAAPALAVGLADIRWTTDASCADYPLPPLDSVETTGDARVEVQLTGCSEKVVTGQETRTWTETRYREEQSEEEQCTPIVTTSTTITHNYSCYESYNTGDTVCTAVGTRYDTERETTYSCITVPVTYLVPYEVELTDTFYTATRVITGRLEGMVSTPDLAAPAPFTIALAERYAGRESTGTPTAPASASSRASAVASALDETVQRALSDARSARLAALTARADALAPSQPEQAVELYLAVESGGVAPSESAERLVLQRLDLPAGTDRADVPRFALPRPYRPQLRLPYWRAPREPSVIRNGYPPVVMSVSGRGTRTEKLERQPLRTGIGGRFGVRGQAGLMSGYDSEEGFGLHTMGEVGIEIGARTSAGWDFPSSEAAEFPLVLGWDVQVAALLGVRDGPIGLFGGLGAYSHRHIVGGQTSRGLAFPVVGHLELRLLRRYPIGLTVWGSGLRTQRSSALGARLDLPIADGIWFTPRLEQRRLRTVIHGLDPEDPVDAGFRTLEVATVGITFALD
jgi:hypothetical protein